MCATMRERITTIMEIENLSPTKFAELLKIQPSNISHLISGRNKPSFELLEKILITFPHISGDWLITGHGSYNKSAKNDQKEVVMAHKSNSVPSLFDQLPPQVMVENAPKDVAINEIPTIANKFKPEEALVDESTCKPSILAPKVSKIVLIYDDNSFEELHPKVSK